MVFCYARLGFDLVHQWTTNPLFSYGYAVPCISAYLVWTRKEALRALPQGPDYVLGVTAVLLAAVLFLLGGIGAVAILQGLSFMVALAALILLVWGRPTLRLIWFPVVYLLLMLPAWDYVFLRLQQPSQELSARIATKLLRGVGIPALLSGTTIAIPTRSLDVLRECSGVSQLIALMAMVLPAAYLWLGTFVRRAALIAIAIVVGYATNGARITLIGWLAEKQISDSNPDTFFHTFQGLVIAALGYAVIGGCLALLARRTAPTPLAPNRADAAPEGKASSARRPWLDALAVTILLLAGMTQFVSGATDVPLRAGLQTLPSRIGDWTAGAPVANGSLGLDEALVGAEAGRHRFEGVDDELVREYRNLSSARVRVYVGYYRHQEERKELAGPIAHALNSAASRVVIGVDGGRVPVSEVTASQGTPRGVLFWYHVNGRIVPNIYWAKGYTSLDALIRRRTNAAVVLIAWGSGDGSGQVSREDAIAFAESFLPHIQQVLQ
jgi:EpsI family protein